jgi:hypothetical protein
LEFAGAIRVVPSLFRAANVLEHHGRRLDEVFFTLAFGINPAGQIVGTYEDSNFGQHGFSDG